MKNTLVITGLLCLFFIQDGYGQLKFGIRGGITQSSIKDFAEFVSQDFGEIEADLRGGQTGWLVGVVTRIQLGPIFIPPEIHQTTNTSSNKVKGSQIEDEAYLEKHMLLNLPVMAGIKFGPLRLNAGPEAHVNVNKTSDLVDFDFYKNSVKTFTLGWTGGVGLDLMGIMLDVRYSGNLGKLGTEVIGDNDTIEFDKKPGRWAFTVGFFL